MKKARWKKNFQFGIFEVEKVKKYTFLRMAAMPQKCQTIFRKIRNGGRASRVKEQSNWQSNKNARIADAMPWHCAPKQMPHPNYQ